MDFVSCSACHPGPARFGTVKTPVAQDAGLQELAFVPGAPFFAHQPDMSTFRLSFATADVARIEEGIERLGRAL